MRVRSVVRRSAAMLAALLALAAAAPALAGRGSPAPAAADRTLGMAMMSAGVNAGCTIHSANGALTVQKQATGICDVLFIRELDGCHAVAGVGVEEFGPTPTGIASQFRGANGAVRVRTSDFAGVATDLPFTVIVFCPR